jgi:hypothetical protein
LNRRHLEITTYIGCPNNCEYCPQDVLIYNYKGEKTMAFDVFKKILANVPTDVDIHFSGFSEVFCYPQAVDFIKYTNDKGHKITVYTTTVGLTQKMINEMDYIKFQTFTIHNRPEIKSHRVFYSTGKVTIDKSNMTSRGSNLWDVPEHDGKCIYVDNYDQNVVLPNGDVYLCCMDWALKHKLGNLLETNFNDLHRETHYDLCRKCERYK